MSAIPPAAPTATLLEGDSLVVLRTLPSDSVHCCVTSPPYWGLRDYRVPGQIGLEPTLDEFLERLAAVFEQVRRVLHPSGVCFVDMGDSYCSQGGERTYGSFDDGTGIGDAAGPRLDATGLKPKDRCLVPFRLALLLQSRGWWVRDIIAWTKPAPMPESVTDRCTQAWEPILMLTKSARYFFDPVAIAEPTTTNGDCRFERADNTAELARLSPSGRRTNGAPTGSTRNPRNVWPISPEPFTDSVPGPDGKPVSHFASFPSDLPRRCILAATSARGVCPRCLAPWIQSVERNQRYDHTTSAAGKSKDGPYSSQTGNGKGSHDVRHGVFSDTRTTGWLAGCTCGLDPIPATVLDPFAGTATTLAVALELRRSSIGIELSPSYLTLARRRLGAVTPGLNLA